MKDACYSSGHGASLLSPRRRSSGSCRSTDRALRISRLAPASSLWQLPVDKSRPRISRLAPAPFLWQSPVYGSRPPHLPSSNALLVQFGFTNICHCTTYRLRRLIENYHLGYVVLRQFDAQLERKMTACHKCDTLS